MRPPGPGRAGRLGCQCKAAAEPQAHCLGARGRPGAGGPLGRRPGPAVGAVIVIRVRYRDRSAASGATTLSKIADVATGQCLISGGVGASPSWGSCAGSVGPIVQVPATTANNTITPTVNGVVGLTVNGTSGTAATATSIVQGGAALALNVTSSSTGDGANINLTNTSGTQTNGLAITRNGAGGTTTNLLNLTNTAGTATNALSINGTFTNLINATNFSVTNAGALTVASTVQGTSINGTTGLNTGAAGGTQRRS